MKKFSICFYSCPEEEMKAWKDTGFICTDTCEIIENRQFPDVICGNCRLESPVPLWDLIEKARPKVVIINAEPGIVFPHRLSRLYNQQVIHGKGVSFIAGSKLQGKIPVPDWYRYAFNGILTTEARIKALAGAVYKFLLEDLMRENEEWCGHMSSVVGPM
jgi:hypothetical protein